MSHGLQPVNGGPKKTIFYIHLKKHEDYAKNSVVNGVSFFHRGIFSVDDNVITWRKLDEAEYDMHPKDLHNSPFTLPLIECIIIPLI